MYVYMFVLNSVVHTVNPNDRYKNPSHRQETTSKSLDQQQRLQQSLLKLALIMTTPTVIIYSAPNKESTFSEILISAVKSTFSHSNLHKSIKELFWISFLKIRFSPIYNP